MPAGNLTDSTPCDICLSYVRLLHTVLHFTNHRLKRGYDHGRQCRMNKRVYIVKHLFFLPNADTLNSNPVVGSTLTYASCQREVGDDPTCKQVQQSFRKSHVNFKDEVPSFDVVEIPQGPSKFFAPTVLVHRGLL